jgi:hypothetical protein
MSISTYFRSNIHQNDPEIFGVNLTLQNFILLKPCKRCKSWFVATTLFLTIFLQNLKSYTCSTSNFQNDVGDFCTHYFTQPIFNFVIVLKINNKLISNSKRGNFGTCNIKGLYTSDQEP